MNTFLFLKCTYNQKRILEKSTHEDSKKEKVAHECSAFMDRT